MQHGELDGWGGPRSTGRLVRGVLRDLREEGVRGVGLKALGMLRLRLQLGRVDWTPRRLWMPLESIPIDRPIFIVGVQGGGVTVLARCLYRHPQAVYASGNSSYWAGQDEIHNCQHVRGLPETMVHRSFHFGNLEGRVVDHPRYGTQRAWLYAVDDLLAEYRREAADASEEEALSVRQVLRRLIRAYAHDPQRARFVDMSQLYTVQVPYLATLLEGCEPHFVLAVRNPYVTCARAAEKEYLPERGAHIDDPELRISLAVEHWTNSMRAALACRGTVPMTIVRYEDFLEHPRKTVAGLCRFAKLDFHESQLPAPGQALPLGSVSPEKWYPLRPAENERYLRGIDPRVVALLEERGGDLIRELGYELHGGAS